MAKLRIGFGFSLQSLYWLLVQLRRRGVVCYASPSRIYACCEEPTTAMSLVAGAFYGPKARISDAEKPVLKTRLN
jgi:hypothetical protein